MKRVGKKGEDNSGIEPLPGVEEVSPVFSAATFKMAILSAMKVVISELS